MLGRCLVLVDTTVLGAICVYVLLVCLSGDVVGLF
jgi:hypothetical protein